MFIQTLKTKIFALFDKSGAKCEPHENTLIHEACVKANLDWLDLLGDYPDRLTSGPARTLEALLHGKRINCLSTFNGGNFSRLRDYIASLQNTYGWVFIESEYKTVETKDHRKLRVKEFWLSPLVIESASMDGAVHWCKSVRIACREQKNCSNGRQRLQSSAA